MGLCLSEVLARQRAVMDAKDAERVARQKAKELHDARFITVSALWSRICSAYQVERVDVFAALFEVLRADWTPLYCRWAAWRDWADGRDERDWCPEDARWSPLPPCPVVYFFRLQEQHGAACGQAYTHVSSPGTITTPDPLMSACGVDWKRPRQGGSFYSGALAIRIEDAERLFGDVLAPISTKQQPVGNTTDGAGTKALTSLVNTFTVPSTHISSLYSSATEKEKPEARQDRRLAALRSMGADFIQHENGWKTIGKKGVLAKLERQEEKRGSPKATKNGVRLDLMKAVERESEKK